MNSLKKEKKLQVLAALIEGNSIRSTERMTGVHRDTIMRLAVKVGEACEKLLDDKMKDLDCRSIECDEIWTFVGKKQRRLTKDEQRNSDKGDQYVFVALDADTKLVPSFKIGRRDGETATEFMVDLRKRLSNHSQLTSDGFAPYIEAVEQAFGCDVDFAQLIKVYEGTDPGSGRYSPPRVTETHSSIITGTPDIDSISTSYVERQNLTMRMQMRRFTRLTNAFSKKLRNLKAAVALHFAHYNFCRIHKSLRMTPAMRAGVTDRLWDLSELVEMAT